MKKNFKTGALWLAVLSLSRFRMAEGLNTTYQYRSKRLLEKLIPEVKPYEEIRTQLIRAHVNMINGQPEIAPDGQLVFKTPEDKLAFEANLTPIADEDVEIDFQPLRLTLSELKGVKIDVSISDAIEPLCEIIDDIDNETVIEVPKLKVIKPE